MGSLSFLEKENKAMYEPLVPDIIHIPYGKIEKLGRSHIK